MLSFIPNLFRRNREPLSEPVPKSATKEVSKRATQVKQKVSNQTETSFFTIKKTYGSDGYDKIVPWLIKHILPAGSNGVWFGQSQSFKTFALIDIACRIALGLKFSGLATRQGLVFIIAAEGDSGLSKRIRAWELQNEQTVGKKLIVIPHAVFPSDANQRQTLVSEIEAESKSQGFPVALIIFDTMSQCSNGMSENEAGEVSRYLQSCKSVGEPFGATVINVHHTKKDSDDFRGSSTIVSNVDFLISMKRNGKQSTSTKLNLVKMKEGSTDYQLDLQLDCCEIDAVDEDGEPISTLYLKQVELSNLDRTSDSSTVERSQYKRDADWLKVYLSQCNTLPASLSNIKQAMSSELDIPLDDKLKMRIDRAKKHLVNAEVIAISKRGKEAWISLLDAA